MQTLLNAGAKIDLQDYNGYAPLKWVYYKRNRLHKNDLLKRNRSSLSKREKEQVSLLKSKIANLIEIANQLKAEMTNQLKMRPSKKEVIIGIYH